MITKSIYAMGSKGHHRFTLNVQEDSTSISENQSLLSFKFIISATNSTWQWRSYNNITYSITIGENTYTGTIPNFNGNTTTIRSISGIEITHNNDGTKTIPISFRVVDPNSVNYTCGNASESSTMVLTDLHTPPSIDSFTTTELNISGIGTNDYVNYISKKQYVINAITYDDATITEYRVLNGDRVVTSSTNTIIIDFQNYNITTALIDGVVRPDIKFEIIDNKGGKSVYQLMNLSLINYAPPNIITTSSNIKRNGQSTGEVNLNLSATFTAGTIGNITNDINTISLQFAYWKTNEAESTIYYTIPTSAISISENDLNIYNWTMQKNNATINDVDVDDSYYFKIIFIDAFNNISEATLLCNQGKYLMCKFKDRVDFLKATQKNNPILAASDFDDINYEYIILDNGLAMCWYQETITTAINSAWGSGYLSGNITLSDFPIEFENPPMVFKSLDNVNYTAIISSATSTPATATNPGNVQLYRNSSATSQRYKINIFAVGKIKSTNVNQTTTTPLQEEI